MGVRGWGLGVRGQGFRCRVRARPMKVEWKMRPYLGVLPLVLSARKSAFSAPGSGSG